MNQGMGPSGSLLSWTTEAKKSSDLESTAPHDLQTETDSCVDWRNIVLISELSMERTDHFWNIYVSGRSYIFDKLMKTCQVIIITIANITEVYKSATMNEEMKQYVQ